MTTLCTRRLLSAREVSTIRAALRLWVEIPPEFIPASCYVEIEGAAAVLTDPEIEGFLRDLADEKTRGHTRVDPLDGSADSPTASGNERQ